MSQNSYGLIRIIGNYIPRLHNGNNILENLIYIIKNEKEFPNTEKIWILNRIVDRTQRQLYIDLLEENNYNYLEIPFNLEKYRKVRKNGFTQRDAYKICQCKNINNPQFVKLQKSLYQQNLYLCNNNGSRNFALEYGKKNFTWSFVLDGNSFFLEEDWMSIVNNIEKYESDPQNQELLYTVIPMVRIGSNKDVKLPKITKLPYSEPQIGFKNTSTATFNEKIPYGASPKAELLRMLSIPGPWNNWCDNVKIFNIKDRPKIIVPYLMIPKVLRLYTGGNFYDQSSKNSIIRYILRVMGLHTLCSILNR